MRRKVSIIGAGNVGASAAERIVMRRLADVVLVDIVEGMPQGKSLDLNEAGPVDNYDMRLTGTNGYDATANSDVVVITSGLPRKPGMSRDDLLAKNFEIVKQVTTEVAKRSPKAVLIIVSNPLDAMAHTALKVSGFPRQRVLGMAGVLDSARMRFFISEALGVSVADTHAFVLGGHGDTMVPLPRYSTVAGIPIPELLPKDKLDAIVQRTRDGGVEVVNLLKSGSAYYAPASSVVQMVEAILLDEHRILPCAAYLEGEYGYKGLFLGVPVQLGEGGLEKVIEIKLTAEEKSALDRSAAAVRELVEKLPL
jgi:malate dehydrogenase